MGFLPVRIIGFRGFCVTLLVTMLHATVVPLRQSHAKERCVSETSAVFNQALSTHGAMLLEVLASKRRGRWQPDGTFRKAFLSQNARALRDIRNQLSRDEPDEPALLQSFRRLLHTKLPKGVQLPRAVRGEETEKFRDSVRTYLSCLRQPN